jgi:hypothetical protein
MLSLSPNLIERRVADVQGIEEDSRQNQDYCCVHCCFVLVIRRATETQIDILSNLILIRFQRVAIRLPLWFGTSLLTMAWAVAHGEYIADQGTFRKPVRVSPVRAFWTLM